MKSLENEIEVSENCLEFRNLLYKLGDIVTLNECYIKSKFNLGSKFAASFIFLSMILA